MLHNGWWLAPQGGCCCHCCCHCCPAAAAAALAQVANYEALYRRVIRAAPAAALMAVATFSLGGGAWPRQCQGYSAAAQLLLL
jgi:hypothetical protein